MATNTNLHQRYKEIFDNEIRFKKVHLWIEIKYYYSYELEDDVYDKITDFIESILDRSDIEALLYFIVEHIDHQNAYFYFLHKSIKNNNILIFNFLLDQNIDTDFDDLLQHSIRNHQIDFVEQLLNKVKNIDVFISSSNFYHSTFLSLSVKQNQFYNKEDYYYITNLLLKKGANPSIDLRTSSAKEYSNIFDDSIPVIISMVNQKEDPELLKIFLRYGVNIQYFNLKAFLQRNNFDSDVLDIFISNGYDVSFFFDDYQFGFKEDELIQQVERFLPDAPIEIIKPIVSKARIIGHHDIKLLYYSAMANRFDVVKLLVSLGANLRFLYPKSIAEIFFAGSPEYRTFTAVLSNEETLANTFYTANRQTLKFWSLRGYKDSAEDTNLENMARSMLSSFSNLIVQYLTCNGAPRNWHDNFSLVLKSMIVKSEYVENAKYNESYYSARDNANDGWNAAFEIFPGDGDFPDYL